MTVDRSEDRRFSGVFIPATTPFDPETGDVAPVDLRMNLRRWAEASLNGIVLFGSTGEGVMLDPDEREQVVGFARDVLPDEMSVVAGAGAESTRQTIRLVKRLADAGVDAVLVHPPVYFGSVVSPGAILDHFRAVADASPVPVILYHMPKYTRVYLDPGLIGELAEHPNVPALKDSSGDLKRLAAYVDACGDDCSVLVGNGALFYSALELGAAGGIMALGLLAPEGCCRILERFRAEKPRDAGRLQERLAPVHRKIVGKLGVPGVKHALDRLGMAGGRPRPPLQPLREKDHRLVARVLQDAGLG